MTWAIFFAAFKDYWKPGGVAVLALGYLAGSQLSMAERQRAINAALDRWTPLESTDPPVIHRAMRYSLFAGGKRIRPILCMASAEAVSDDISGVENAACALALLHTYSLIHHDLPALDNDDPRTNSLAMPVAEQNIRATERGSAELRIIADRRRRFPAWVAGSDRLRRRSPRTVCQCGIPYRPNTEQNL